MKNRTTNHSQRKLSFITGLGLVLLVAALAFSCYTLAKYLSRENDEQLYVAKNFYFSSDYLQTEQNNGEYVLYTLQDGVTSIDFELRNHVDSLRYSDTDITYDVYLDGVKKTSGTIAVSGSGVVTVSLPGITAGEHTVVVTSTSPYTQTIGARFKIVDASLGIQYEAHGSAEHPMMQLTVRTNNYSGYVHISWGEGVIPDKTDPLLFDAVAENNFVQVYLSAHSEYTFTFLKSDLTQDLSSTLSAAAVANP